MSINFQRWEAFESSLRKNKQKLPGLADGSVNLTEVERLSGIRRAVFYPGSNGNKKVITAFQKALRDIGTDTQSHDTTSAEERAEQRAKTKSKEASKLHKQLNQKTQEIEQLRHQIEELKTQISSLDSEKTEHQKNLEEMSLDGRRYFV
ncbi:MAG: hypothetical protein K6L60_04375 [Oceanobacter sp.]